VVVAIAVEVRRCWATAYGRWVRVVAFDLFFVVFKSMCRELYCSRYMCAEGDTLGSRHRLFAGPAVPSAQFPLGTGCAESKGTCAENISLSAEVANPVVAQRLLKQDGGGGAPVV
jgi:hypothetical protein